jgi:hypothetical protein
MWRRENRTKGASPTAVFRSPSRFSGEAYTFLLYAVCRSYNNKYDIKKLFIETIFKYSFALITTAVVQDVQRRGINAISLTILNHFTSTI